jgi:formylglycine-generating enzyme required for sulfatase activity
MNTQSDRNTMLRTKLNQLAIALSVLVFFMLLEQSGIYANNIQISNVTMTGQNNQSNFTMIQFTVSWDNSWRDANNWDAAWIFVKYDEGSGFWRHAFIDTSDNNHIPSSGSVIKTGITNVGGTNKGIGVFIYRSSNGSGPVNFINVKLRWNYGSNNLPENASVLLKVYGMEMVYVPQGGFTAGDGVSTASIGWGGSMANPLAVNNENLISFGISANGYYTSGGNTQETSTGGAFSVPAIFPKGFNAFYCMKYEVSQKQYVDFLNALTPEQEINRYSFSNCNTLRNTICGTQGNRTTSAPDRACNYLGWADHAAYLDWSGLRPMTELEFEKACRGPLSPNGNEFAWGSTILGNITSFSGTDGSGTETKSPGTGTVNLNYNSGISGPVRCGIFSASNNGGSFSRLNAGATYYGIMEMSGNLSERVVTIGNPEGRAYSGVHGDGILSYNGNAFKVTNWPGIDSNSEITDSGANSSKGTGLKGGSWSSTNTNELKISGRVYAAYYTNSRGSTHGARGVRTAP